MKLILYSSNCFGEINAFNQKTASQSPKLLAFLQEELKSAISAIVGPEVGLGWMCWSCFEYAKWLAEIFESLKSYSSCHVMS